MSLRLVALLLGASFAASACCAAKKDDAPTPHGNAVDWKGDAKACAAIKACCGAPEMTLFCSLTQSANQGDCGKSVATVRAYAKESKVKVAPVCF
jgi:hypothetical protein